MKKIRNVNFLLIVLLTVFALFMPNVEAKTYPSGFVAHGEDNMRTSESFNSSDDCNAAKNKYASLYSNFPSSSCTCRVGYAVAGKYSLICPYVASFSGSNGGSSSGNTGSSTTPSGGTTSKTPSKGTSNKETGKDTGTDNELVFPDVEDLDNGMCTQVSTVKAVRFFAYILDIFKLLIPAVIVITGVISLSKAVLSDDDGAVRKSLESLVTKLILGGVIVFVPLIITTVLKHTTLYSENNCVQCALDVSVCDKLIGQADETINPCYSILGSVSDKETPAYYSQLAFRYMQYIGIILCVVLSGVDFFKVLMDDNKDGYKAVAGKALKRVCYVIVLLLLPVLVEYILTWVGAYSSPTCGIK